MFNFFNTKKDLPLGKIGEKAAVVYLKRLGYIILCTNFTNTTGKRLGEIDIIAKDGLDLVFVEVKTRKTSKNNILIIPEENINSSKLYKLKKITNYYLKINNLWDYPYRFDAISLLYNENEKIFNVKHLKNIFL